MSRIKAYMKEEPNNMILTCFQCDDAACVRVCPVEALVRIEETAAIKVLEERCIRCGACTAACPFGHMESGRLSHVAIKCDLCDGNPACAAFCPTKCLEYK
jgi:Fe-S-cluster-containing hydrogenase component 2